MDLKTWLSDERGRLTAIAKEIGIDPQLVWQYANTRPTPLDRCVAIEKATAGQVTCEELRPDMVEYFAYLRGLAEPDVINPKRQAA